MPHIELYGSSVAYFEQGSGEPVVLLHSSGSSSVQWRALAQQLSPRFRVLAPDLYGYGASANWSGAGAFCLGHEALIVRALLDRLDGPVHLVGQFVRRRCRDARGANPH